MPQRLLLSFLAVSAMVGGTTAAAGAATPDPSTVVDTATAGHDRGDSATAQLLGKVTRSTQWTPSAPVPLHFKTFHPQGIVRVGDHYFMTSVEILQPTTPCNPACGGYDRTPGAGIGHLFEFDAGGNLLRDLKLHEGDVYHPGGLDYDGRYLWVPVAEYRPNSHAIVYRIGPATMAATKVMRVDDHIGGIVHDLASDRLNGVSWGSRTFYTWNKHGKLQQKVNNPEQFIDFQDCHYLQKGKAVCGGVAGMSIAGKAFELGGLSLLDLRSMTAINTVPITQLSPAGHSITRNPVWLQANGNSLQLLAVPDDDDSSLLTYSTPPLS
jgi:hypothetical protein